MIDENKINRLQNLSKRLVRHFILRQSYIRKVNKEYDSKLRKITKISGNEEKYKATITECNQVYYISYGGEKAEQELGLIKDEFGKLVPEEFYDFKKLCALIDIIEKYAPDTFEDALAIFNEHCCEFLYNPYYE